MHAEEIQACNTKAHHIQEPLTIAADIKTSKPVLATLYFTASPVEQATEPNLTSPVYLCCLV